MEKYLHIGGVVAVRFDPSVSYLLVITHTGRGVFSTRMWDRLARDIELAYPSGGIGLGIGPIDGQPIQMTEMDFNTGKMRLASSDGRTVLECESNGIAISERDS